MADTRRWVWLGVALLACGFVYLLHPILSPFLVALLLAYLFDPLVDRLEHWGLSRTWGVVAVFALFTLIVMTLLLVLVPMLAKQLVRLYELAPQMLDWVQHSAMPWVQSKLGLADGFWKFDKVKAAISEHMGQTTDIVGVVLSQATASGLALIGWLANLVLIPVVSFYLLRDWDLMMAKIRSLLPRDREERVVALAGECHEVLGAFVRGQLLVMLALAVFYTVGLSLFGLDLAFPIGVFTGLAVFVPYLGFGLGLVLALLAGLLQFSPGHAVLMVAVVYGLGQMVESFVLTPRLVGERIGLHPLAVILALMAFGQLLGFVGVLIALPASAVLLVGLRRLRQGYLASPLYRHGPSGPDNGSGA